MTLVCFVLCWVRFPFLIENALQSLMIAFVFRAFCGCLIAALWDTLRTEWELYTERRLMKEHRKMAVSGYAALLRQHEVILKIRHDMTDQLRTLKGISDSARVDEYIESLIGQQEKVRSVVQTRNEMLDIMLNGKLSEAQDCGTALENINAEAPKVLPVSGIDLCSLVMNIMNNAIRAAASSGAKPPFIRLNIHIKNNCFPIICQNTADMPEAAVLAENKKPCVNTVWV